jgi:ABC-type polysaccharide/polyol phosphate transport system ATPase subunit
MKPAIRIDKLSKCYRLGARTGRFRHNLTESLRAHARDLWQGTRRRLAREAAVEAQDADAFWALKDVSFEVRTGEVVGIIGRNGAGKSTLLKLLSLITEPTSGRIEYRGRIASLLEVGTGFHPELTGRENVYMNGSLLGMSRQEIARRFDEIVAFSEIGRFLDTPVKRYSSGMYVRLAFAVAAHLRPEILIVDEVLAVGDAAFQAKCVGKMDDVAREGRTVLFVSHNMAVVQKLCSRGILLESGRVHIDGSTAAVIDAYQAIAASDFLVIGRTLDVTKARRWGGNGVARLRAVGLFNPSDRTQVDAAFRGGDLGFRLSLAGDAAAVQAASIYITDLFDRKLINVNTLEFSPSLDLRPGQAIELHIRDVHLRPGRYKVGFWLGDGLERHIDVVSDAAALDVLPARDCPRVSEHDGFFRCPFEYRIVPEDA